MTYELALIGGEKTFNLKYDTSEDVLKAVLKTSVMEEAQPRPIWHQPDGEDGNELGSLTYDDGRMDLKVVMEATTWPELLAEVEALRRTCEQAHAHAMGKAGAAEVCIRGRPAPACAYTYYTVKLVEDRSGGYLSGVQVANVMIDELAVTATVAAFGYGDEETLANELRNGHMLLEGMTSGLAEGLTLVGSPTPSLDTDTYLIGGQSQQLVTDSSSEQGIYTEIVTLALDGYSKASVWMPIPDGDEVWFFLWQGTTAVKIEVASFEVAPANAVDRRIVGGETWYKFEVSGKNEDYANVFCQVVRRAVDATQATTINVDGFYLEVSTTAVPASRKAWADYPQIYGRNDAGQNLIYDPGMELGTGWSSVGSPTTSEKSAEQVHSGDYSWKFVVDAANEGVRGLVFSTVTGKTYRGRVYVYPDDGTRCRVRVRKGDNSGYIYDTAHTGLTQDAWNEIEFEFTETAGGAGAYLAVNSDTQTSGTFYVDDADVRNPQEFRNYVDVWGIPGSQPAWLNVKAAPAADLAGVVAYFAKAYVVNYLAEQSGVHLYDIGAESGVSETRDGGCNGNSYQQETIPGYFDFEPGAAADNYLVLVRVRSDDAGSPTVQLSYSKNGGISYTELDEIGIDTINRWLLLTLGIVSIKTSDLYNDSGGAVVFNIASDGTALSHIDYDFVRFLPYGSFMIIPFTSLHMYDSTGQWFQISGRNREIVAKGSVYDDITGRELGAMWTLEPGRLNRLAIFVVHEAVNNLEGDSDTHRIDLGLDLDLRYRARTRGWLP